MEDIRDDTEDDDNDHIEDDDDPSSGKSCLLHKLPKVLLDPAFLLRV